MSGAVDVHGILERTGADADAPEGSQAWALARVDAVVVDLLAAAEKVRADDPMSIMCLRAAAARFGGAE